MFKKELRDLRKNVNRTTSLLFVILLFGALGAGFFFVVQNVLGVQHILGLTEALNENRLWLIMFWATDFFFISLVLVLSYLIAGIPAIAPALSLSIYFAHFAGTPVAGTDVYSAYFSTPVNLGGGANIGYMGYLIMAVFLAYCIKYLFIFWNNAKEFLGRKIDKTLNKKRANNKDIKITGVGLIENVDLIVLVLLLPVISAALTFILIRYGIEIPFSALSNAIIQPLTQLSGSSVILCGIVMGLMVGFDIIGPVSMAAFSVAIAAFYEGNSQLMTIYSACFIATGWVPLFTMILNKITKKGGSFDNDDFNLAVSGPINAFFENVKLTVAFSMPYACRSPLTVIPSLMTGSAVAGLLTALFGINNTAYLTTLPKYGNGETFAEMFKRGEHYISFTLPLRSGDWLSCRIPLFFIILAGGCVGGALMLLLKQLAFKHQKKIGTYVPHNADIVVEMRNFSKKLWIKFKTDRGTIPQEYSQVAQIPELYEQEPEEVTNITK